jgi:hypothetical protein
VRRHTVGSQWDGPITAGIALFGLGAVLDSTWGLVAAVSFPLTGKFYLINAVGNVCYLLGATRGLKTVAVRLMSDDALKRFMKFRVMAPVLVASAFMLICVVRSPITSTMPAESLYFIKPDGWLVGYWLAYFLTLTGINSVAMYGAFVLRSGPRSLMHDPLVAATALGNLACWGFFAAIVTGQTWLVRNLNWPSAFLAIIAGAVALSIAWRHRVDELAGRRPQVS